MKNIKGTLPNILTLINLSLGVIAILLAVDAERNNANQLFQASLLVMIAALTDRFDGKVARLLDVTSDLGKELDSLSDLISFGVAPVIIAWKVNDYTSIGFLGYLIAVIFPVAGAYRLARYNITTFDNVFRGIPITIAGAFLSIMNLYSCFLILRKNYSNIHSYITIGLVILLSFLMVSKIKFKKI
ncbi:MAG: CDP-diacylglycerol--serine O-phosphatidyltransferase [Bacillota bacterium]|nr:CDP-diacylglycerol--serine O-phosphatidyltransferase [Bacillota bacterium]